MRVDFTTRCQKSPIVSKYPKVDQVMTRGSHKKLNTAEASELKASATNSRFEVPGSRSLDLPPHQLQSQVIITGMSSSGKHTVFKALEDSGYFCVDNLSTALIPRVIQMMTVSGGKIEKLAIVADIRLRKSVAAFKRLFQDLKKYFKSTSIFVDASDQVLARRYSETRRAHPLAKDKSLTRSGLSAKNSQMSEY